MVKLIVREPETSDIDELIHNLRDSDRKELVAMSGPSLVDTVGRALWSSSEAWAFDYEGELYCLAGVTPVSLIGGVGCPWMLGTTLIDKHPRSLMDAAEKYLEQMMSSFPKLVNYVDARNKRSIRWLSNMGFEIHEPTRVGYENRPFHRFDRGYH